MKKKVLIFWVFLRLPLLLAGLYLFRTELSILIEKYFNLALVLESVIYLISTAWLRLLLVMLMAILLIGVCLFIQKWLANKYWTLLILIAFAGFEISFRYLLKIESSFLSSALATLILALNTIPESWLDRYFPKGRVTGMFFTIGAVISEGLFIQSFVYWLADFLKLNSNVKKWSWITGILLACFYSFFLFTPYNNQRILTLGEKLLSSPSVEKFAEGGYNWLDLNLENNLLYASGHNVNYIIAYDTQNLSLPPLKSKTQVGKPQSFAYNPILQELYVYRAETQELLYLDAVTLELLRSVPIPNLSPGDVWVNWQSGTDTITIASEADFEVGTPFLMLSRESGEILASIPLPLIPTNVAFDSENNIFFFNSFRDIYLVAWDMKSYQVIQQTEISQGTDRLIYNSSASEILIASAQEGAILRHDATTLEFKGKIETSIGDRTLALDQSRNLLLVGNFINNYVQIIDLTTYQPISRFYIGPWIRTITLDTKKGIAYISTIKNIFKLTYIN